MLLKPVFLFTYAIVRKPKHGLWPNLHPTNLTVDLIQNKSKSGYDLTKIVQND